MKNLTTFILLFFIASAIYSQNITNTLGAGGVYYIKDASTNFYTLTQTTGTVNILKGLRLEATGNSSTTGVIFKGTDRFIHNFAAAGAFGFNTFMGINSSNFTLGVDASYNTSFGHSSLTSLTDGQSNSAFGYGSLYTNSAGLQNSGFGDRSLYSNTTGNYNSAFGYYSLYLNSDGNDNSAFGNSSLQANISGFQNSAFGSSSLQNTTGSSNTAIGNSSGNNITSGSNNICIGYNTSVPTGTSSNQVRIGNTSVTYAGIQVAWTVTSDRRWKRNILSSNLGLGFISKLNPVSYTRKNDEKKRTEFGLIAQEVEEILKEYDITNSGMITVDDKGNYELRYNDLIAPMIKAIKELKVENEKKETKILQLKNENTELKNRFSKIERVQILLINKVQSLESKDVKSEEVKSANR